MDISRRPSIPPSLKKYVQYAITGLTKVTIFVNLTTHGLYGHKDRTQL